MLIRFLFIILTFFSIKECFSQTLSTESSALLFVEDNANIHVGGNAIFNGELNNTGHIEITGNVNFIDNVNIGSLSLNGLNDQLVEGKKIVATRLALNKEKQAILLTDSFNITNELILNSGILSVSTSKLNVLSGLISGGSEQSYVTGVLSVFSSGLENLLLPVGIEDNYEPLTIHTAPIGHLMIEVLTPDPNTLIPGDSLIGLASGVSWKLTSGENVFLNSQISINYNNLDLQNFPIDNPIRANNYAPVIAYLDRNDKYTSLEVGDGSDGTRGSAGNLVAKRLIQLSDSTLNFSIGVTPTSDGLQFYVPTIFAPSGSISENRKFRSFLLGTDINQVAMTIWDKFNNKVFSEFVESTPLEHTGWDGVLINGNEAPQGVYYFRLSVSSSAGLFEKEGTVLLIR